VPPLELWQLGTVLDVAAKARNYRSDLTPDVEPAGWTRLSVLINHVAGLAPAGYRYDPGGHALHRVEPAVPDGQWSAFLRRAAAALLNYNLDQAAAIVVISGRLDAMLSSYGARGYRVLNAEAGSVAQATYLAATALDLGCGAVLNLDNVAINEALGFDHTDERSLLYLLIGGDRDGRADLDYRLG
jgi:SagB-type dehydrogenase family enzyme